MDTAVITLSGIRDGESQIARELAKVEPLENAILDLRNVQYLSGADIGAILKFKSRLSGTLRLRNASTFVREILNVTKVDAVIAVV